MIYLPCLVIKSQLLGVLRSFNKWLVYCGGSWTLHCFHLLFFCPADFKTCFPLGNVLVVIDVHLCLLLPPERLVLQLKRNLSSAAQAVVFLLEVMDSDLADQLSALLQVLCHVWLGNVACGCLFRLLLPVTSGVSDISATWLLRLQGSISMFIKKRS